MTLKLHSLFTDHAVLQRGTSVPVWGTALPGSEVVVVIANQRASTIADHAGNWRIRLQPLVAGGSHLLQITSDSGESVTVRDVFVGDVYLCSGQSNMEWPVSGADNGAAECAAAHFPQIRLFQVPKRTAPTPQKDVAASWTVCSSETVASFSAVGYFFGREIHQTQNIPIGLINASWGGTVCEAWTSSATLQTNPALKPIADRLVAAATQDAGAMEQHARALRAWEAEFCYADPGNEGEAWGWAAESFDDTSWDTMRIPTAWERTGLNIDGAIWFRRELTIPSSWIGRDLILSLGTIDDFDDTYINGVRIGGIDVQTPDAWAVPRRYTVPASLVRPCRNVLAIRVFDRINDGGIIGPASLLNLAAECDHKLGNTLLPSSPGTPAFGSEAQARRGENRGGGGQHGSDALPPPQPSPGVPGEGENSSSLKNGDTLPTASRDESIPLAGDWKYRIELRLEPKTNVPSPPVGPLSLDNQNCPAALYNGMIHPLMPYALRGVIWYQGESNRDRAAQYRTLFPTMIQNWRDDWGIGEFPFFFVELARWNGRQELPGESELAELREAQACALALPAVGRATIIDTGDALDIHPTDKQTVGHRLALAARSLLYGEQIESAGPTYASMKTEANAIRVTFTHTSGGLIATDGKRLRGFAVAGSDRRFVWADARIEGVSIVVRGDHVSAPVAVRYGWADNPDCNLSNGAGIPASPFRTDEWPGLTSGRS